MASDPYWAQELYSYDGSNNLIKIGKHKSSAAKQSDASWYVWTLTYDGSNNLTGKTGPVIGAWA